MENEFRRGHSELRGREMSRLRAGLLEIGELSKFT